MDPISPASIPPTPQSAIRNPQSEEAQKLRRVAQDFEGVFVGMLLKAMRSTVGKGGLFREGSDTKMFQEMFDEELGRSIARSGGGIGLSQMILRDQARRDASASEKKAQGGALDNR